MLIGESKKKKPTLDELVFLWKEGNRRLVAKYLVTAHKSFAMEVAAQMAIRLGYIQVLNLIRFMDEARGQ